ncbi:tetratricopeptide repeat protein [Lewinella sp. IMCC34183]|uniref:tetratricopeptide repeat protein n=1 Tax=Lewinella sp. IMCC34183 TaxID=2248762 RepID=UPI000E268495|nr:hypothetical protein [Lewinella sp. IMCC34183]
MKPEEPTNEDRAQELLYDAYEAEPEHAVSLVRQVLKLDPDNADAYLLLADLAYASDTTLALDYARKGVAAGKRRIGKKFRSLRGQFWGFLETRPYMRAKLECATLLYELDRIDECLAEYAELIELNPLDNQGNRYPYASVLVESGRWKEYAELQERYAEESSAMWLFPYALYRFKTEGDTPVSLEALRQADLANAHVIPLLLREVEPEEDLLKDYYSPGDETEALTYLHWGVHGWLDDAAALEWLSAYRLSS